MQNTSPVRRSATALLGDFAKVFLSSIILDDATPGDRRQTGFARKSRLIKDFRPGTVFLKLWQELEPLCRIVPESVKLKSRNQENIEGIR
jgi:hypothetical protein